MEAAKTQQDNTEPYKISGHYNVNIIDMEFRKIKTTFYTGIYRDF